MHLQLDKEAILLGSLKLGTILSDPSRTPTGVGLRCWHGDNLTDIAFTGEGAVDGSGKPWWEIAEASRLHLGMHRVEVRHRLLPWPAFRRRRDTSDFSLPPLRFRHSLWKGTTSPVWDSPTRWGESFRRCLPFCRAARRMKTGRCSYRAPPRACSG